MADIKSIHRGRVIDLGYETFDAPDGQALTLEIVRHSGGAAVVALNMQNEVCLLRQYRHAAGGWIVELPAGKIDNNEDPALTARRELREETGYSATKWHSLDRMISTPGFCDEIIHLYLARELQAGETAHEASEYIEVFWQPLASACEQACAGKIYDAKTVIGLLRAQALVGSL